MWRNRCHQSSRLPRLGAGSADAWYDASSSAGASALLVDGAALLADPRKARAAVAVALDLADEGVDALDDPAADRVLAHVGRVALGAGPAQADDGARLAAARREEVLDALGAGCAGLAAALHVVPARRLFEVG